MATARSLSGELLSWVASLDGVDPVSDVQRADFVAAWLLSYPEGSLDWQGDEGVRAHLQAFLARTGAKVDDEIPAAVAAYFEKNPLPRALIDAAHKRLQQQAQAGSSARAAAFSAFLGASTPPPPSSSSPSGKTGITAGPLARALVGAALPSTSSASSKKIPDKESS